MYMYILSLSEHIDVIFHLKKNIKKSTSVAYAGFFQQGVFKLDTGRHAESALKMVTWGGGGGGGGGEL